MKKPKQIRSWTGKHRSRLPVKIYCTTYCMEEERKLVGNTIQPTLPFSIAKDDDAWKIAVRTRFFLSGKISCLFRASHCRFSQYGRREEGREPWKGLNTQSCWLVACLDSLVGWQETRRKGEGRRKGLQEREVGSLRARLLCVTTKYHIHLPTKAFWFRLKWFWVPVLKGTKL